MSCNYEQNILYVILNEGYNIDGPEEEIGVEMVMHTCKVVFFNERKVFFLVQLDI